MAMQHDAWVDLLLVRSPSRAGDVATQRPARGHYVWTAWPRGARQPRDFRITFTLGASITELSRLCSWWHAEPAHRTFVYEARTPAALAHPTRRAATRHQTRTRPDTTA